ncbi:hypothetical protein COOONC_08460 [Cooperia oncophora]
MHKLSAKLSMSPKAPTNQRKKSSGFTEADRRLARAQQLMDADLEQHTVPVSEEVPPSSNIASTNVQASIRGKREEKRRESGDSEKSEHARQKPQPVPVAPVQHKRSTSPIISADSSSADVPPPPCTPPTPTSAFTASYNIPTSSTLGTSMPISRPSVIPVSAVHPTVYQAPITGTEPIPIPVMLPVIPTLIPGLTLPIGGMDMTNVSLGALAEYYGQISAYDDSNIPPTPTPSLASSTGNDRAGELREMSAEFARTRRRSESEQSVASELSAAPDWLDEVVGPDDVDDDFFGHGSGKRIYDECEW